MNPMELMQALTDMDDDVLLRAELDPPRKRTVVPRFLRYASAACLMLLLVLWVVVPIHTDAGDNALKWTLSLESDGFAYEFWNSPQPEQSPPYYAPTWVPEGFELSEVRTFDGRDRTLHYRMPLDAAEQTWEHLSLSYYYVGKGSSFSYSVGESFGRYTLEKVTIGTLEADHYHYEAGIGYLIWIDPEEQIYFALQYDKVCGANNALRLARSIQILEEETP